MTTRSTIRNAEPAGSDKRLTVEVVSVGDPTEIKQRRHVLQAGEEVTVEVSAGQFVMMDDKES